MFEIESLHGIIPPIATPQAWIDQHARAIIEQTGARVLLYNVPLLIGDIHPETIAKLEELENVVGIINSGSNDAHPGRDLPQARARVSSVGGDGEIPFFA